MYALMVSNLERPPINLAQALSTLKADIRNAKIKGGAIVNPVKNKITNQGSSGGGGGERARDSTQLTELIEARASRSSNVVSECWFLVQDDPKVSD